MNAIGVFAGRGDVVLAMGMALVFGVFIGWKSRQLLEWAKRNKFGK